jgi:signal transduction histidine kinase
MCELTHSSTGQTCPVSKLNCSGICVYADIIETVNIGIGVCDTIEKTIIYTNRLFSDLFGGIIGSDGYTKLSTLLLPDAGASELAQDANSPKQIQLDGRILGYTVYRAAEKFVWILVRDITEKHQLQAVAEAVNASTNIGYIFSGVRHEIGNPINSMKVALSVLKENFDGYSRETVMKYFDRMLQDIGRVEYLLQSLKNFNMYETQRVEDFDVSVFMEKFLSLVRQDIVKNGINLKYEPYAGVVNVNGDKRALHQVLLNVMTNAVDALEGRDDPCILLSMRRSARTIRISVEDNGCGISQDQQKVLFKPFFTSKPKGTGLGLVISQKMMAHMNGMIAIESVRNQGTIVRITLPEGNTRTKNNA